MVYIFIDITLMMNNASRQCTIVNCNTFMLTLIPTLSPPLCITHIPISAAPYAPKLATTPYSPPPDTPNPCTPHVTLTRTHQVYIPSRHPTQHPIFMPHAAPVPTSVRWRWE